MKPYDTKLIMVVAQSPFNTDSGTFCKLVPLRYVDGGEAEEADFLNDGEIWWMLTPTSRQHAIPGKLIVGDLEDAIRFDRHDPLASEFQVKRESAHAPGIQDCVELLTLPTNLVDSIEELAEATLGLSFDHTPTPHILLEWRDKIVGPFHVEFGDSSGDSGRYSVTIRPKQANREVLVAPLTEFKRACGSSVLNLSREFTQSNHARRESGTLAG